MTSTSIPSTAVAAATVPTTSATSGDQSKLHQAAQAFEAIFVRQMLASARQTNFGDDLWGNDQGNDTFTAMRDERFADIAAKSGAFGLAHQIETQLAPKTASSNADATTSTGTAAQLAAAAKG
ncbi:peptidoglycan hydrolase [Novosphingobium nitrogenifigens DSM 19370]|uniref:Peptidoglycan hydrolase n=1 Tax=Novosphingobium nitrogenifigens DSM 19370 TaxID=983920 RepID=F1Z7M7_9SPHN|nr:rod-binding protein [Novosphingobium nitrogenifigens]EGD59418.1 peptidoglycan hydrolase [Novosphingobium nitrogenifigens DSM 19370]